jgi:Concanavalin A-like lectin/glucanases superfamily
MPGKIPMLNRRLAPTRQRTTGLALLLVAGTCGSSSAGEQPAADEENPAELPAADVSPLLYGLDFDGADDYVEIADFRYDGTYPITIEAIVLPHSDKKGTVFADYERSGIGLHLRDRRFMFNVFDSGLPTVAGSTRYRVAAADEQADFETVDHIAGVFDGAAVQLFVNGKPQQRWAMLTGRVKPSGLPFWFGANPGPGGRLQEPFHGRIDAVRLSRGVAYETEFTPPRRFEKTEGTLILLNLEEGTGETVKDESGNGYDGTIHGANWVRLVP